MELPRERVELLADQYLQTLGPAIHLVFSARVANMPETGTGYVTLSAVRAALRDHYKEFWEKYADKLSNPPSTL